MMIIEISSGKTHKVEILPVVEDDFRAITKSRFWFNWKDEKDNTIYKLVIKKTNVILGFISLEIIKSESRISIHLLAISKENRGANKNYDHIVGCLIAFAAKQSVKLFGEWACISLIPKTKLTEYYKRKYLMLEAGKSLFLDGRELIELIKKYDHG